MGLFSRNTRYDRARALEGARRAQTKRRRKKAIRLYRRVLMVEPGNPELHAKLAPLLAETGQLFDAWVSFRTTGRAFVRNDEIDKALGVYREAARRLPRQVEAWLSVASLERKRGRNRDAVKALLEGRRHFRHRAFRPQAIHLLRRAREIDPWDPDTLLALARLLGKAGQRDEELALLQGLAGRCRGRDLRRVRSAQVRTSPTPAHAWAWLRALLGAGGGRAAPGASGQDLVSSRSSGVRS